MRLLFAILFVFAANSVAFSQAEVLGHWSFMVDGGFSSPISSSMQGSITDLYTYSWQFYFRNYPFGDVTATSHNGGGQIAYRFIESPWSLYAADHFYYSYMDDGYPDEGNEYASLLMNTISFGSEYTLGKPSDAVNFFGRFAMTTSIITAEVQSYGNVIINFAGISPRNHIKSTPAVRLGIDLGSGLRWNMHFLPIALEASISYLNANIIGKQYTQPILGPDFAPIQSGLNDARNPADPDDHDRAIAYVSFKLGTRVWF